MNIKMKKVLFLVIPLSFTTPSLVSADGWFKSSERGVAPVENALYKQECSGCHYAYQPGLLPARSWEKIMKNLDNHFGDNAELSKEDTLKLTNYAVKNASDNSNYKRSKKIHRSISKNETPIRITEVAYIKRKHRELSRRHLADNPEVKTLGNCQACHTKIDKGSFSEREINIPGFGAWDD